MNRTMGEQVIGKESLPETGEKRACDRIEHEAAAHEAIAHNASERDAAAAKEWKLRDILKDMKRVAVAYSGGVDSTYLLRIAREVLGGNVCAVTVLQAAVPERECAAAKAFCKRYSVEHVLVPVDVLSMPVFAENPPDRCYHCKKKIFTELQAAAAERGILHVADGTNESDGRDYRPGMRALRELGIRSPLREAGMTKAEIRERSRAWALPTWDQPSAACLASRFAYGEPITEGKLRMVEQAEEVLRSMGIRVARVRMHGETLARIEVTAEEMDAIAALREQIVNTLQSVGFTYVTMDLQGYRTGSMNEVLRGI